jgi:hypothetical protein
VLLFPALSLYTLLVSELYSEILVTLNTLHTMFSSNKRTVHSALAANILCKNVNMFDNHFYKTNFLVSFINTCNTLLNSVVINYICPAFTM